MMKTILRAAMLAVLMLCSSAVWAEMVNINKADAAALMENLPGIGETKAKAIVKYRKENGNFKSIDDLLNVPGIGEKTFANLKSEVSVNKGATKATGKKPITSVKQTGAEKKSAPADKSAKKDSKAKSADKSDKSKSAKKESKSADKAKTAKKDSKSADKDSKKAKSDSKSKSSSKSKSAKSDGKSVSSKKKPKPKATPKSKKSSTKKKKSSTKKKKTTKKQ